MLKYKKTLLGLWFVISRNSQKKMCICRARSRTYEVLRLLYDRKYVCYLNLVLNENPPLILKLTEAEVKIIWVYKSTLCKVKQLLEQRTASASFHILKMDGEEPAANQRRAARAREEQNQHIAVVWRVTNSRDGVFNISIIYPKCHVWGIRMTFLI